MSTPLTVVLCVLGGLILLTVGLLALKATLTLEYANGLVLRLRVLCLDLTLFPSKKKKKVDPRDFTPKKYRRMLEKKRKKEQKKRERAQLKKQQKELKKQQKKKAEESAKTKKRSLLETVSLVKALIEELPPRLLRRLKIKIHRAVVTVTSPDAAKTALLYGAVSQALAYTVAFLDQHSRLEYEKDAEVTVNADFLAEKTSADVKISVSLRVWHVFDLALAALKTYLRNK